MRVYPLYEDRSDVPQTLPAGGPIGEERYFEIGERKIRVFVHTPKDEQVSYPVYINFHGGGMVHGFPEMDESICAQLCKELHCVVINVEYRLAPEHPFPCSINDGYDAVLYVARHAGDFKADITRIAIGGESAGGNISAAISILANRKKEFAICGMILTYAAMSFVDEENAPIVPGAVKKSGSGFYRECYSYGGADLKNPLASPVLATTEDLKGTPATLVITAEFDTLRTDAEKYAVRLIELGTTVIVKRFSHCVHGFTHRAYKDEPQQAIQMMINFLGICFQ